MPRRKVSLKRVSRASKDAYGRPFIKSVTVGQGRGKLPIKKHVEYKPIQYTVTSNPGGKTKTFLGKKFGERLHLKSTRGLKTRGSKTRKKLARRIRSSRKNIKDMQNYHKWKAQGGDGHGGSSAAITLD